MTGGIRQRHRREADAVWKVNGIKGELPEDSIKYVRRKGPLPTGETSTAEVLVFYLMIPFSKGRLNKMHVI